MDAEVQADGKTVILTLTTEYKVATDIVVTVEGIYVSGSIKEQFPKFSQVINVNDTVAPKVSSITAKTNTNAAQNVTVQFSEPIKAVPSTVKVNGDEVTGGTLSNNNTTLTLTGLNLSADKVHELELLNFEDYAEHKVDYVKQSFSVTKDSTSAEGTASVLQDNKVQIKFDKPMNLNSLKNVDILRYDSGSKSYVPVKLAGETAAGDGLNAGGASYDLDIKTGKIATFYIDASEETNFFGLNDTSEALIVKVKSGVLDSSGNQVKSFEEGVTANQVTAAPSFDSITFDKDSKDKVTKLYFHFGDNVTFEGTGTTALVSGDITVTDLSTNTEVPFANVFGTTNTAKIADDGSTLIVEPEDAASVTNKLKNGKYSFEVNKDLVKDTSFAKNGNKKSSKTVDFGAVANNVTVDSTVINDSTDVDNLLTVNFTKAVTAESAKNPANYSINGNALPNGTVIKVNSATQVQFTLPANTVKKSDAKAVLNVKNVKAQDSSATFVDYVGTIDALDNTAPEISKAEVLQNGLIQLTFSEAVTVNTADFEALKLNGKELSTTASDKTVVTPTAGSLTDGTQVVTIKATAKVAEDFDDSGFTYMYIDVDGDDSLDFNKDIILKSVEDTSAPAEWNATVSSGTGTADADLSLLDSVEVLVPATAATKDKSDLDNDQTGNTPGNKIAPGVVKAK